MTTALATPESPYLSTIESCFRRSVVAAADCGTPGLGTKDAAMTRTGSDAWGGVSSQNWGEGVGLFASPPTLGATHPKPTRGSGGVTISLGELNPHFVCVLCFGYFVDATTITECMHTFCRSCIVTFLKEHRHCPHCDTLLLKTRPLSSLRSDRVLQTLVYKTVPGLFQTEMRRRVGFYRAHPHAVGTPEYRRDVEEFQRFLFNPDDFVSLAIRHYDSRRRAPQATGPQEGPIPPDGGSSSGGALPSSADENSLAIADDARPSEAAAERDDLVRYFRCPATVPVAVLKQLVKSKHRVPDPLRVELLHGEDRLLDAWTLMEVAYIYSWNRESPLELSFQVVATRRVKKRRHTQQSVLSDTQHLPTNFPPPQPCSSDGDDVQEPPEKIAKMENSHEESERRSTFREQNDISRSGHHHMTPLSPEDHHGRPPTPPETPESQQHHQMHHDAKCEESSSSSEEQCEDEANFGSSTHADSNDGEEEDENLIGDQDSEAPLEVDTSHETEPELEIETETDDANNKEEDLYSEDAARNDFESVSNEEHVAVEDSNASTDPDTGTNVSENDDSVDVKPPRRVRRNVVVQAGGQDGSCAFSDSDVEEPMDEVGALDLSDHARNVREARARGSLDLSRGQGTQTMLSITQSKTSKKKHKNNQVSPAPQSNWTHNQPSHAAAFHDLLTLSQAAVIQLALVQARAQEEAKKSLETSKLGKLRETADTLSFVNGSGDTLTISAINSSESGSKTTSEPSLVKTQGGLGSKGSSGSSQKLSAEEQRAVTNTIIISRAGKHGTLKSKLNKSPTHKASASSNPIRVPSVGLKSSDNASKDSGGGGRTSDPIFKITNQKLSECFRQQLNNKLKLNGNTSSSSSSISGGGGNNKSGSGKPSTSVIASSTSTSSISGSVNSSNSASRLSTGPSQMSNGMNSKVITKSSVPVATSGVMLSGAVASKTISQSSTKLSLSVSKPSIPSSNNKSTGGQSFLKTNPIVSVSSTSTANTPPKLLSSIPSPYVSKLTSSSSSLSINPGIDKDHKISSTKLSSLSASSAKQTTPSSSSSQVSSASRPSGTKPTLIIPSSKPGAGQTITGNKPLQSNSSTKITQIRETIKPPQSIEQPKPTPISISKSTVSNGVGFVQNKALCNGSPTGKSSNTLSKPSTNGVCSSGEPLNKTISSSSSSSTSNVTCSSSTPSSLTSVRSQSLTTPSSRTSLVTPYRSLLSCTTTTPGMPSLHSGLRTTSTANTALVRATNSSVRQIPNPSLLHQQSESRLNGGRLTRVLGRLNGSGSGLSRIESLTRSLHEKAAGAAAAAVNTAAR